ncbi:hypothetical protein [Geodermatophilus telluris]|uniref:hypothetical protein n=1 Tax=Geodermatophilus telluris TaxID=1190417 RepID=UPI000B82F7A0|nr:hypothetical protein [Geodermatophilus telluris]
MTALTKRLRHLQGWVQTQTQISEPQELIEVISSNLDAAEEQLGKTPSASSLTVILAHLDSAQTDLLRLAPTSFLHGALPNLVMQARKALAPDDLRLLRLEQLATVTQSVEYTEDDRQVIVASAVAVNEEDRRNRLRLESFRRIILATTGSLVILATIAGVLGSAYPSLFPVCFTSTVADRVQVACPTATSPLTSSIPDGSFGDVDEVTAQLADPINIVFLEFLGVLGAALSTAIAIKNLRGSGDPYNLSLALVLLKTATGALIALFGIILVNAGLVPGIEVLDTSSEIIAWALVLGYAQQLFTGVIDRRAASVLEEVDAVTRTA